MIDLHKGTTLIEASAGTGKTYTLCRIALQLTLQKGITLDRILAVTFTEAATEELAARIHELYQDCLHQLETGTIKESLLVTLADEADFDPETAKNALRYSLETFDEAPISTIHGFCKRSLDLVALETQTPLDAELSHIEDQLIEQLQSEYIRQNILEASTALSAAYSKQKDFAKRLAELGRQAASHPEAVLRPSPIHVVTAELDRRFNDLPGELAKLLQQKSQYLPHLGKARKPTKLLTGANPDLGRAIERGYLTGSDLEWLEILTSAEWSKAMNKSGQGIPIPAAIALIDTTLDQITNAFTSLIYNYRGWLFERLAAAKRQANVISFNDLLHLLHRALRQDPDQRIARFLAGRYDAALIDEFQDTDRTQLEIAQILFGHGEHYLFYIGDPKQAIYRFRGADIYAYFQATNGPELRQITLGKNYRSDPRLVAAVNHLFANAKSSFIDERIAFHPVKAARETAASNNPIPPFRFHQLQLQYADNPPGKGEYREILANRAANDFASRLNAEPDLKAEEVTFLVNDKNEANALSEALLRRGISSAILADRSVFQTQEAADLHQLLASLASPARANLKRGAYARLNRSVSALEMRGDDFDQVAIPFFDFITQWSRDWLTTNFDVALNQLLELGPDANSGHLDLDTERRNANFSQLAELLSEARDAEELSPRGLMNWLRRKQDANVSQQEDWQTRISSDYGKPQILTVHKSKGLQFPIVVLPFVGLRRVRQNELSSSYHGPDDELIIDFAPEADSPAFEHSQREALAEDVRLLYVALTRAVQENIVYLCPEEISKHSKVSGSSFAQFLLGQSETTSEAVANALEALAASSHDCMSFDQSACEAGPFTSRNHDLDTENKADQTIAALPLSNRPVLPGPDRILSFSALSKSLHHDSESSLAILEVIETESDEAAVTLVEEAPAPVEDNILSIFTLPKGTRAGDLLHLILERFDFAKPDTLAATTQQAFDALQFEPREFEPIVAAQIGAIARAELKGTYGMFRLEQIESAQRIAELEFSYPVNGDVKNAIVSALRSADLGAIPRAWIEGLASEERGLPASMLRGFIDLVLEQEGRLYIFDWKSNYLGPTPERYDHAAMLESMSEHNYFLQYLLYCVALKRYVAWRFPQDDFKTRFGGVFYLYARGITPGKQTGIYYDLPSIALLDQLDSALTDR